MRYSLAKVAVVLRTSVLPGWLFGLWAALRGVPDWQLYQPTFHPWLEKEFRKKYREISDHTLVSPEGAWILSALAQQALTLDGDFLEAGVYRGGTARLLHDLVRSAAKTRRLHLFDTFQGTPETDLARDRHKSGDFQDTSLESVSAFVGQTDECVHYYKGLVPDTFARLTECRFAFAHVDVDIHRSVLDCCEYSLSTAEFRWNHAVRRLWAAFLSRSQIGGRYIFRGPTGNTNRAEHRTRNNFSTLKGVSYFTSSCRTTSRPRRIASSMLMYSNSALRPTLTMPRLLRYSRAFVRRSW